MMTIDRLAITFQITRRPWRWQKNNDMIKRGDVYIDIQHYIKLYITHFPLFMDVAVVLLRHMLETWKYDMSFSFELLTLRRKRFGRYRIRFRHLYDCKIRCSLSCHSVHVYTAQWCIETSSRRIYDFTPTFRWVCLITPRTPSVERCRFCIGLIIGMTFTLLCLLSCLGDNMLHTPT